MTAFSRLILLGLTVLVSVDVYGSGLSPLSVTGRAIYPFNTVGKVVSESGQVATGTLVADNLVLTHAASFLSELTGEPTAFHWVWQAQGAADPQVYAVSKFYVFDSFQGVAEAKGAGSASALNRDLMLVQLESPIAGVASALINVGNLDSKSYRMIVGYAADLYGLSSANRALLHATGAGESVDTVFGKVDGRLFQTGDLKAAKQALGAPVFSFYDGVWSIDGIVVENDVVNGATYVLELDSELVDFVTEVLVLAGGVVVQPDVSILNQDANTDAASAITLAEGMGRLFSIAPEGDADFHRIVVSQAANYTIESFGVLDVNGTLFNSAGQFIIDDDDSAGSVNYRIDTYLKAGEYYLWTKPYSTQVSGVYGIIFKNSEATDPTYLDEGINAANLIELPSQSTLGLYHLENPGELDAFRLFVSAPGHFIMKTSGEMDLKSKIFTTVSGALPPYDSSEIGQLWDQNDDFPGLEGNTVLDVFLPVGEYVVTLEASNSGEYGAYRLSTNFYNETLPVVDAGDASGGFSTAVDWVPGEKITGRFDLAGDRDTFKFTLASTSQISVQVSCLTDVVWYLFDADLNQLATSGVAKVDPVIEETLAGGTYYLVLAAFSEQQYSLK